MTAHTIMLLIILFWAMVIAGGVMIGVTIKRFFPELEKKIFKK